MAIQFVDQLDLEGKRVLARFDFNVPLQDGKISDTTRVDRSLETIRYILEKGASKLILMSHLGRPKGKAVAEYSLDPVASYLAEKLGTEVVLTESCTDSGIRTLIDLPSTKVVLLQNLRYHPEEEKNDREFAKLLASYGDIYLNDAFGTCHRKHASTYELNAFFKNKCAGGFLLKKEIEALDKVVNKPKHPFVGIVGGAKVSDKIKIIESLLIKVDYLLIGGAMAYPFLKAKGYEVGTSLCSEDDVQLAKKILITKSSQKIVLPGDHIVSEKFGGNAELCGDSNIPGNRMGLDIGPATLENYSQLVRQANTILWNGPMGLFENERFSNGTFGIAKALADSKGFSLVGGGDSVSAVNKSGLADHIDHISTGGGASLEFIESGSLPGIQALRFGID